MRREPRAAPDNSTDAIVSFYHRGAYLCTSAIVSFYLRGAYFTKPKNAASDIRHPTSSIIAHCSSPIAENHGDALAAHRQHIAAFDDVPSVATTTFLDRPWTEIDWRKLPTLGVHQNNNARLRSLTPEALLLAILLLSLPAYTLHGSRGDCVLFLFHDTPEGRSTGPASDAKILHALDADLRAARSGRTLCHRSRPLALLCF